MDSIRPVIAITTGVVFGLGFTRADGPVVHDSRLNVTWLADGNLAATQTFGVSGINKNGSMDYATALGSRDECV